MEYPYGPGSYETYQLQQEIGAAGLPVPDGVNGTGYTSLGSPAKDVLVLFASALTPAQKTQLDSVVAAHTPIGPRKPRPLYAIRVDVQALSVAQFSNVWNDLSANVPTATPPAPHKYLLDTGPNGGSILVLDWCVYGSGAPLAQAKLAQHSLTAMYVQDNPKYLIHPPFDPSIDVPGDQPA